MKEICDWMTERENWVRSAKTKSKYWRVKSDRKVKSEPESGIEPGPRKYSQVESQSVDSCSSSWESTSSYQGGSSSCSESSGSSSLSECVSEILFKSAVESVSETESVCLSASSVDTLMEGEEPSVCTAGAEGGAEDLNRSGRLSREMSEGFLTSGVGGPSGMGNPDEMFMRAFASMIRKCSGMPGGSSFGGEEDVTSSSSAHGVVRADRARLVDKILPYR